VAEALRPELAGGEASALRHAIEQPVDVTEPPLLAPHGPGGDEQGTPALERTRTTVRVVKLLAVDEGGAHARLYVHGFRMPAA